MSTGLFIGVVAVITLWIITLVYWLIPRRTGVDGDRRQHDSIARIGHVLVIASLIGGNGQAVLPRDVDLSFFFPFIIGTQITGVLAIFLSIRRQPTR